MGQRLKRKLQPAETTATARTRRRSAPDRAELEEVVEIWNKHTEAVRKYQKSLEREMEERSRVEEQVHLMMQKAGFDDFTHLGIRLQEVDDKTRASTTIDPKGFYDAVEEKDFFEAVKVSVTAAKKVLSEREIKKISTVVDPKVIGKKLKITPPKV